MNNKKIITMTICSIFIFIACLSILSFANNESGKNAEAEGYFEKANELRKTTEYEAAITEYNKIINALPKSRIAQDAQYWIAQSYLEMRQLDKSLSEFKKLLDDDPGSPIAVSTKLMIERVQQAKKNRTLFEAIKKADIEQVKSLIAEGADVDAKWGDTSAKEEQQKAKAPYADSTPLYFAVDSNNIDVVKLLVKEDPNVNAGKWPPLCQAVEANNKAIAEYLIEHGAKVNYPKDWGPLLEAIQIDSIEMVKLLIEKGADVNVTYNVPPPLQLVVLEGRKDIFDLLIQHGADGSIPDKLGYTPMYMAIHNDDSYFMKTLIAKGADINSKYRGGETLLQSAAITGRKESVKLLLEAGANINAVNEKGQTALHRPLDIRNSNYNQYRLSKDTIELLLTKGADVNLKDKNGRTPLHLAVESADADIVKLILDKGSDVNTKEDESGFTALHNAVRFGKVNVIELLISRGADINAKDKQGHTPLYVAVNHDYKISEFLMNKGADSAIKTESGKTLLQLAQERKQLESAVPDMIFEGEPNSFFGHNIVCGDVDGDGYDDILIREAKYDNNRGRVYLFYGGPDMDTKPDLILEGQNKRDLFGSSICCGDIDNDGYDDIVIGAGGYSENRGCAYLYWGSDRSSMDAKPDMIFAGEQEKGSRFGDGYPTVYDIDNDGYDDIILGAYQYPSDGTGRAYLYYGNTKELMDTSADLIFKGENKGNRFGYTISCGDVDNDGYGDIVIGTYFRQGRAYLYYGSIKSNMDAKADVIFEVKSESNNYFGNGIVCIDQNRDGYDDVVIGARGYNNGQGRAYLFNGSSKSSMDAETDMIFNGEVENSNYGVQVICGDIDGDKVNDLVIGTGASGQWIARVYVYWGKELSAPNPKPGMILKGEKPNDLFGYGLACGDVNKDGFDDLVIGAHNTYKKAGVEQGRVYLYYGGPKNK